MNRRQLLQTALAGMGVGMVPKAELAPSRLYETRCIAGFDPAQGRDCAVFARWTIRNGEYVLEKWEEKYPPKEFIVDLWDEVRPSVKDTANLKEG